MKQVDLLKMIGKGAIEVNFSHELTAENLTAIIQAVRDNRVHKLQLYGNQISLVDWKRLAGALRHNTALQELTLVGDKMRDEGAIAIAGALRDNNSLRKLNLERCSIGAAGAQALATTIDHNTTVFGRNNALKEFILYGNNIGDDGARAMATMLRNNSSLQRLDLGYNGIHLDGIMSLSEAVRHNFKLTTLNLNHRYLYCDARDALCRNVVLDIGAQAILDALQNNTTLTEIDLPYEKIKYFPGVMGGGGPISVQERVISKEIDSAINDRLEINSRLQSQYRQIVPTALFVLGQSFWRKDHMMVGATPLPTLPKEIAMKIVAMATPKPGDIPRPEPLMPCSIQ